MPRSSKAESDVQKKLQQGFAIVQHCGQLGVGMVKGYIHQGPQGVSVLCLLGGMVSSALGLLKMINIFTVLVDPLGYILNAYLFIFGLVTICLEVDIDCLRRIRGMEMFAFLPVYVSPLEFLRMMQSMLHEHCKLLTYQWGRGFLYLFLGVSMASQCTLCLLFVIGMYHLGMGVLCVAISIGYRPDLVFSPPSPSRGRHPLESPTRKRQSTPTPRKTSSPRAGSSSRPSCSPLSSPEGKSRSKNK
eukprot:gnl/MRDRNA2_/MRDRNA2_77098_c0_seq2.p1 gnl/MRDRNA2_/MRDRNA2_77098_c0~~gnl/MRDRNA2_/MRDRNA2_77098_c0_seq2.p1  ORF type:complete len:245 (+),score=28.05 gnl/MRDRNA2_/MRDRNA2_77098_c0_seq2:83-817(+)